MYQESLIGALVIGWLSKFQFFLCVVKNPVTFFQSSLYYLFAWYARRVVAWSNLVAPANDIMGCRTLKSATLFSEFYSIY
jgi:hypothetical protein